MKKYTELNEVLKDVDNGVEVFWSSFNYRIVKQQFEYFVKSPNHRIGLLDGNGNPNIDLESVFSHSFLKV
jgi:hypothetical protein